VLYLEKRKYCCGGGKMKIASWNVNGIRACREKGFLKFLSDANPDIMCCQEVKGQCKLDTPGYLQYWFPAARANYSGVLMLTKREPVSVTNGLGDECIDAEGRLISLEYPEFFVVNVYAPSLNPHSTPERHEFRYEWDRKLLEYLDNLPKPCIVCGDFNVARSNIDIYPENQKNSLEPPFFESEIRAGFERYIEAGLVDAFRAMYPEREGSYTWWGPKNRARELNMGSRLDYILVSAEIWNAASSVKHYTATQGSDHCPVSIVLRTGSLHVKESDAELGSRWRTIDWSRMEEELFQKQKKIAEAAYHRDMEKVERLQAELIQMTAARALAVRAVAAKNSASGVDGIKWKTAAEKMNASLLLTPRNYYPLPCRYLEIEDDGKKLVILVPTMRDRAMLTLFKYALDPVEESLADKKSFFSRRGRSAHDLNAYLIDALSLDDGPEWVVRVDVRAFYASIMHKWLLSEVPMKRDVLRKLLQSGVIRHGELMETVQGISYGSPLSAILGNRMLDGLQSYLYDRLYPDGGVDYANGDMFRFADDILVTARSEEFARLILFTVEEFLQIRGLAPNEEKTYIAEIHSGFEFLALHYKKKNGVLEVHPAESAVAEFKEELRRLIMDFKGTYRDMIEKINMKLTRWAFYFRDTDAYRVFRDMDAFTEEVLIQKLTIRRPRWHRETILNKYWIKVDDCHVFALPQDPTTRVVRLASLEIVRHKPCKLSLNPYLDKEYYDVLKHQRNVQRAAGIYSGIWNRQNGRCAYCKRRMLPDQELDVVERVVGAGHISRNLIYVHKDCTYSIFMGTDRTVGGQESLHLYLEDLIDPAPLSQSPYSELTEYFRKAKRPAFSLTFKQIEGIIGDELPWEAFFYETFWYSTGEEEDDALWKQEGCPYDFIRPSAPDYSISHSWLSQGYEVKRLHLEEQRIVFRQFIKWTSPVNVPAVLLDQRLPDEIAFKANKLLAHFVKEHGL